MVPVMATVLVKDMVLVMDLIVALFMAMFPLKIMLYSILIQVGYRKSTHSVNVDIT